MQTAKGDENWLEEETKTYASGILSSTVTDLSI